jgi:signal transduction histidine kinase/CheY-like chemotaxis protein
MARNGVASIDGVTPAALRPAIERAWSLRYRDPAALAAAGAAIVAQAAAAASSASAAERGWGALLVALGERARGQAAACEQALAAAEAGFQGAVAHPAHAAPTAHAHTATEAALGLACCRTLRAAPELPTQPARVLAQIGPAEALDADPHDAVQAYALQFVLGLRSMACNRTGRWDDALRDRLAALAAARRTGDDGAVAHALADLASLQADLFNPEDALALASEAVALSERAATGAGPPPAAWVMAAFNRLGALLALDRPAEAEAAARALQPRLDQLHPRLREEACLLLARALLPGGDLHTLPATTPAADAAPDPVLDEVAALIERSGRESGTGAELRRALVQAAWHLAAGRPETARRVCEERLAAERELAAERAGTPDDLMHLHRLAALAHERCGDAAAALAHTRREKELLATVLGRGARARRLTLEIEHGLALERRAREEAQAREHAAEAERLRLDALNRALESADLAKTRFLAAASHDLRQPVQALALGMAALEHEPLPPTQAPLVQRMSRSLDALVQMLDVLLDISRLDAGIVTPAPQRCDLRALLERLADEHRLRATAQGLVLRLRLPAGDAAPPFTDSDPVLLERCLRNLLDNALKYTRSGGVLLALQRRGPDGAGRAGRACHWRVAVVDTGIGMAPEVLARACDEFFQADNDERDRARGLGLGLAIVQRLARLLGHRLALRSTPGRGTAATLELPCAEAPAPPARRASDASLPADARDEAESGRDALVAVIDDDRDVRESLGALLERWGHPVLAAAGPAAWLAQWQQAGRPPVLAIVSDLRLAGGTDGLAAIAALREAVGTSTGRPTPALVVSGDMAPERLQALRASGLPWLAKPVMPMRLRSWLQAVAATPG